MGLSLVGSGCLAVVAGAAAGAGTYVYVTGKLENTEEVGLDLAWSATQAAIKDLQFRVKDERKDALQARMEAEEADGTSVKIDLESKGEKITKFTIRVGVVGNEEQSRLIMDKIKSHL